jgi:hypothetical protein
MIFLILIIIFLTSSILGDNLRAPGPSFTFGQNILEKGRMVLVESFNYYEQEGVGYFDNVQEFIVGITDAFSITTFLPIALHYRETGGPVNKGLGALAIQAEYGFIDHREGNFLHLMTIVANVAFPTTTVKVQGIKSPHAFQYFIGTTNSVLGNGWYWYNSFGGIINTKKRGYEKLRNRFIYDIGMGKIVISNERNYWALLVEMNGLYFGRTKTIGENPRTRKPVNHILLGPTFRWASDSHAAQFGIQYPITQNRVDDFDRINFQTTVTLAFRF